ncbi:MAG: hypothetical protein J0H82_06700 [Alphaproteobacteria bacterium]|jgi:hypothetical protein|nr:hypothetical protein [Alphaproteobacteria bacterium]
MTQAFDLLAALPRIETALNDPSLDADRRRVIAAELLQSLPTGLSVRAAPATFEYIRERIRYHRDRAGGTEVPAAETGPAPRNRRGPRAS